MQSCLIADDHALLRSAVAGLIANRWPNTRIEESVDFPSAWKAAERLKAPALIVVDLDMPGAKPRAGIAGVQAAAPDAHVIILTGLSDDRLLRDLLASGVVGFAHKNSSPEVLLAAFELVMAGGRYLPPRVAQLLQNDDPISNALSPRQREVLSLLAKGHSNKEIAIALDVSPATVKTHVAQLLNAIGATNRTDAAARARAAGID